MSHANLAELRQTVAQSIMNVGEIASGQRLLIRFSSWKGVSNGKQFGIIPDQFVER